MSQVTVDGLKHRGQAPVDMRVKKKYLFLLSACVTGIIFNLLYNVMARRLGEYANILINKYHFAD